MDKYLLFGCRVTPNGNFRHGYEDMEAMAVAENP